MSYYRDQLEKYLKTVDVNADVVYDIGGGSNPVKNRVRSWNVGKYTILDKGIEDPAPDTVTVDFDINLPDLQLPKRSADIIFCLEVFEYVYDPVTALLNIFQFLKPGGKVYITFPFVYPQHEPVEFDSLRYTPEGVNILLAHAGFSEVNFIYRRDKSGLLQSFYRADGMHPSKKTQHDITGVIVEAIK